MSALDQAARDAAIQHLDQSIALSAGAGSGKTAVLTRRILELLVRGTPAKRIAAITFTEKAAGELQARVRDACEAHLARAGHAPHGLLENLSQVTISTIHGFCHKILTTESFAAAWAPDTEICPDALSTQEVREAYDQWEFDFRQRHPDASLIIYRLLSPHGLRTGAARILSYRDLEPTCSTSPFSPGSAFQQLNSIGASLLVSRMLCTAAETDKLVLQTHGLLSIIQDAANRPPTEAVVRILASNEGATGNLNLGRKSDWKNDGKRLFVAALQQFRAWRATQIEHLHGLLVRDIVRHLIPAIDHTKAHAAIADYNDLLFRAAQLLRDCTQARARLAERFDAVLIDEVQDTDPIQAEVAALLTRAPDATGSWDAHPPQRGRLFAVGDPRQSIYRFRRADEMTWYQLQRLLTRDGEGLHLTENFRSVPGIVEWVNSTFSSLPGYLPQRAHREPAPLDPVVRLPLGPSTDDISELGLVTRYLLRLERDGEVLDPNSKQRRAIQWSDIMILLPSWAKADQLQNTLTRAGIPAVVEGGSAFFRRDEIRLSLAALKCLDEPGDEQSTVFVLRGLFALTWDELARHRAAGGAWRFTIPSPTDGPVADAFMLLRRLSRQRGRRSWVMLLDELLEHSRAASVWALLRDGAAKLANLEKLRALIRQFEATASSPTQALRMLDSLGKEQDLSRVDALDQAVRITSYFKAKGLEAPVVLLCFGSRRAEPIVAAIDRRANKVAIKLGHLKLSDWKQYEDAERSANENERRRWMYVAATRARDQLVIVDSPKSPLFREHFANGLAKATQIDPQTLPSPAWRDQTFADHDEHVDAWLHAPPPPDGIDPTRDWWSSAREAIHASKRASMRWRTVHEVAMKERVSASTSAIGALGGTLVHEVMEALTFTDSLEDQRTRAAELTPLLAAELGLSPTRERQCLDIIYRMLEHEVLQMARSATEHWVEESFAYRDDAQGRVISGRIDLAFPSDASREHWYIVDWKSDLPPRESPGWRNYQNQLDHYARAVFELVPECKQTTTVLVGPHPQLAAAPTLFEQLSEAYPELARTMEDLLDKGLPAPRVNYEVEEIDSIVVALAWEREKIALCIDNSRIDAEAMRQYRWHVITADLASPTWEVEACDAIAAYFSLPKD
ncbi:UvrD-helicase domain-containing protein [Pseudenhygromyxa sp. WMMC2535]|uniref:UvrD-helicase domain-containing protein n=1 Tax=Pseudenhygromyxa sp. WMMC2535 TaxID=2712867 RepID=UPI001553B92E|nr:UvrD-helicase domain-containing protein [Pseudenhygromyxa sp. WMMC2535]NVB40892.1 UvrD-helicase domain-containing protein [Pseudenhygromyxa sp. WMMC2535]